MPDVTHDVTNDVKIRPATRADLTRLTEIYNYYVINTPTTFDLKPFAVEERVRWFEEHAGAGRHRMFVAEVADSVVGYAYSGTFNDRAAYDTSVATSIYCAREVTGRGIGTILYKVLFDAIRNEDIHRIMAGITLPNDASVKIHRRFGFTDVGVFSECGRKFDRYWDVVWMQRPLLLPGE
jgi:phosphinothricin acetyltransferase